MRNTRPYSRQRPRRQGLALAVGLATVAGTAGAAAGKTAEVEIVDFMRFDPLVIEVEPGTTVTWTNYDGSNHFVHVDGATSPRLKMESSWSHTFNEPGTYTFKCNIHHKMKEGTVIVK